MKTIFIDEIYQNDENIQDEILSYFLLFCKCCSRVLSCLSMQFLYGFGGCWQSGMAGNYAECKGDCCRILHSAAVPFKILCSFYLSNVPKRPRTSCLPSSRPMVLAVLVMVLETAFSKVVCFLRLEVVRRVVA